MLRIVKYFIRCSINDFSAYMIWLHGSDIGHNTKVMRDKDNRYLELLLQFFKALKFALESCHVSAVVCLSASAPGLHAISNSDDNPLTLPTRAEDIVSLFWHLEYL